MATDSSLTNEVLNDRNPMTEHNYCKDPNSNQDEEAMDTTESQTTPTPQAPPTPHLSALSPSTDTMESILISLLRSHTQSINEREGGDKQCNNQDDVGRAAAAAGINPLSLDCLSNEQINYLITSSSVNYAAIQEMIVQRSKQYMPMTQKDEPVIMNEVRMNTPSPLPQAPPTQAPPTQAPPTQAPPTQAPPTLNPGTTLTITSHQLRELQSQLTSLLQQQSASIGVGGAGGGVSLGPGSQASIDALNQLLKQQLINMVTAGLPAQDITQPMDTITTSHNPTAVHNPQSVPVNHPTSIPVTPTTVTTPTNITTPTSLPATFFHPPVTQQPVTGTNTAGPQLTGSNTGPQSVTGTGTGTGTAAAGPPKKKKEQEKRIPTAFNVYFSDVYHKVIEENPNLPFSDISKIVSTMWNGLGQEGKQKYYDRQDEMKQSLANKPDTPTTSDTPPTTPTNPKPVKKQRKTSKDGVGGAEEPVKRKKTEGMCIAIGCYNRSCYNEERGYQYCSNDCIISHYKAVFNEWVSGRKQTLKT